MQDEIAQFGRVVLAGERVGIVSVRQQHDPHVQAVFQDHVDPAQRGFDAGAVAVVDHRHVAREAADQPDLPVRQRGARRGDHVFDSGLVHRDDVRVTFDQDTAILLRDRPFGEIDSVQDVAFVVHLRFRRVQVFRDFLVGAHRPAAECGYASADPVDREHDPAAETVVIAARLAFDRQSGADQELLFVAVGQRLPRKSVAAVGTVAESEFPDRGVREPAFAEIADADALSFGRVVQRPDEIVGGIRRDDHHALAVVVAAHLFGSLFAFGDLDAVFAGDVFQRFGIGHVFVFHHEGHGIASLAAAEALE